MEENPRDRQFNWCSSKMLTLPLCCVGIWMCSEGVGFSNTKLSKLVTDCGTTNSRALGATYRSTTGFKVYHHHGPLIVQWSCLACSSGDSFRLLKRMVARGKAEIGVARDSEEFSWTVAKTQEWPSSINLQVWNRLTLGGWHGFELPRSVRTSSYRFAINGCSFEGWLEILMASGQSNLSENVRDIYRRIWFSINYISLSVDT